MDLRRLEMTSGPSNGQHRAVCAECGDDWPCSGRREDWLASRRAELRRERVRRLTGVGSGDCLGCGETVGPRHRKVVFPGANLWRPDLGEAALFHARERCRTEAVAYEKEWLAAWPKRRSLLECRGPVVWHQDGTTACANPGCPGVRPPVHHRGSGAQCYVLGPCERCGDPEDGQQRRDQAVQTWSALGLGDAFRGAQFGEPQLTRRRRAPVYPEDDTVKVITPGDIVIRARPTPVGALVATRAGGTQGWRLLHRPSGRFLNFAALPSLEAARSAALELAGWRWDRPWDELMADRGLRRAVTLILAEAGGDSSP